MGSVLNQPGMFAGMEYNNSDEIHTGSNLSQGDDDLSDSLGALSDELGSFHISQPTTYATNATTLDSKISKPLKAYQTNNSFSESAFISQFHDENDRDNDNVEYDSSVSPSSVLLNKDLSEDIVRLNNDDDDDYDRESIMEYGTVNRRAKQSTRGTTMEISPPQFIPYMKSHMKSTSPTHRLNFSYNNDNGGLPLSSEDLEDMVENEQEQEPAVLRKHKTGMKAREPESALIIKDIGELSGQMMNTFKKKNELQQSRIYHDETTSDSLYNDYNNGNKTTSNNNDDDEGVNEFTNSSMFEDEDPALAAKQVYNNLLRKQGSRFDMKRNITNRTISTRGSSVSGTSHNNNKELNLITPSSIGYRFKHSKGIWVPEDEFQNVSSSQMADTTATTTTNTSKMNHSSTKNTTSTFTMEEEEGTQDVIRDNIANSTTPLDPPRVDQETLLKSVFSQNNSNMVVNSPKQETLNNATRLSDIPEISFSSSKQQAVSLLMSALQSTVPHSTDWKQVHDLKILHQRTLRSVVGLGTYTPNLIKLNLSHNKIGNVEGLPITLKELCLRDNEINDTFCTFTDNNRLHTLDLSHNLLSRNLQILKSSHNLLTVNVSHNNIVSLAELGDSMIRSLDVSYNMLNGIIDFEKIVLQNDNRLGGWLTLESLDLSGNPKITELRHIEKLPCLKVLRVNDVPNLMITHTQSSSLQELEILCSYNGAEEDNKHTDLDLEGFPYLKVISLDGERRLNSAMPSTLRSVTIMGNHNRDYDNKRFGDTLSKIPRDISSLNIIDTFQMDPLSLFEPTYFRGLQQLSIKGCGIGSAYALLSRLPCSQTLQILNVSDTPLVKRKIKAVVSSIEGRNEFKKQLTGLVHSTCPALQQLIL